MIPVNTPLLNGNEEKYLLECIRTGWISSEGPFIKEFEEKFCAFVNRKHGIAVANGSAALDVAVQALELSQGDEVIMPSFTIISPAQSVVKAGLIPVLVDSDPDTWNINVDQIESKITSKTKAIIVVHIYGLPVDMDSVIALCKKHNLFLIEDAAEMHGQTYKGKVCGSFGDISIFSFYPNKHITTGEGGMIVCDSDHLSARCRKLRNLAFEPDGRRFIHYELGWNYRMTNMQAALGLAQLERIDEHIEKKRRIGNMYQEGLSSLKGFQFPKIKTDYSENIFWVYALVADTKELCESTVEKLSKEKIGTRPFFWCMHEQPVFLKMGLFENEKYPVAERLARNGFYLPSGLGLSDSDVQTVISTMKKNLQLINSSARKLINLFMKIAVWVLSDYKQQIGGGFALYDKFIQMIDAHRFSDELEICFVGYNPSANYKFNKKYIELNYFGNAVKSDKIGRSALSTFINKKLSRYSHRIPVLNKLERKVLDAHDVDLVFYPVQGFRKIPDFPFVVSNWDIGHKASYALPELGMNYSFDYREKWYSRNIFKALAVFAESESGRDELLYYTKLNPQRVKIVPLFPGGVVDVKVERQVQLSRIDKLTLKENKYFFYPAQFWAHKNHYNLLHAFKKLQNDFPDIKLVLTGSDKGNKDYIRDVVGKLDLEKSVLFPGFVDNETMVGIYSNAAAMIMPSFLGPTNMPLLEARQLGCPVICSDLPGHIEMMGDGALYFDPVNQEQMCLQMKKVMEAQFRSELLQKANMKLASSFFTSENALKQLDLNLKNLIPVRKSWGKSNKIF